MPSFRSDDALIHYQVLGDGPTVVLLHPFPADHGIWLPVAEALASRYRVLLPDLRGHGASEPGSGPATMEKHVADLVRLLEVTQTGCAVFGGVSIGGYILFEFWRRHGERVEALILASTRATADTDEGRRTRLASAEDVEKRGPEPFLDTMLPKLVGESTRRNRPDLAAAARKMMGRMSVAGIAAAQRGMAARPDSVATLAGMDVPTLILAGEEDTLIPVADADQMRRGIPGSALEVVPAAGHYAVFEQAERCARLIRQFLDGLALT